jgi:hypothetical protein
MRGFRGSRSAQNQLTSRFGRGNDYSRLKEEGESGGTTPHGHDAPKSNLPDWLKTPETREREKHAVQTRPALGPELRVVAGGKTGAPKPAKRAKPAARRPAAKKSSTTAAPARRKAA